MRAMIPMIIFGINNRIIPKKKITKVITPAVVHPR
jgi:hypothetical protein